MALEDSRPLQSRAQECDRGRRLAPSTSEPGCATLPEADEGSRIHPSRAASRPAQSIGALRKAPVPHLACRCEPFLRQTLPRPEIELQACTAPHHHRSRGCAEKLIPGADSLVPLFSLALTTVSF